MIQLNVNKQGGLAKIFTVRLNLNDKMSTDFDTSKGLLVSCKSQLTGAEQNVTPIANWGANFFNDRITTFFLYTAPFNGDPAVGYLSFGQITYPTFYINYPIGFWDVVIYENSSSSNLLPSLAGKILYTGLMNVEPADADGWAPTYKEYTTNDSDTESVYLTPN